MSNKKTRGLKHLPNKRRNPYAEALYDKELPFGHKVETSRKLYKRKDKHKTDYEEEYNE